MMLHVTGSTGSSVCPPMCQVSSDLAVQSTHALTIAQ